MKQNELMSDPIEMTGREVMDRRRLMFTLVGTAATGVLASACQVSVGGQTIDVGAVASSAQSLFEGMSLGEEDEIRMGNQLYGQVIDKQGGRYRNRKAQSALELFAEPVIKSGKRTNLPWEVTLIDDNSVNAWVLPGGKMGINKGLLRYVANEDELAAVIAHEAGHVERAHVINEMRTRKFTEALTEAAPAFGGSTRSKVLTAAAINLMGPVLQDLIVSGYSRSNELEADANILTAFAVTGHDPKKAPDFFHTLLELIPPPKAGEAEITTSLFSTHPGTQERIDALVKAAADIGPSGAKPGNSGFVDLRRSFPLRRYYLRNPAGTTS